MVSTDACGAPSKDSTFSVLLSPMVPQFPATYLVTCGADILRDHGVLMERELKRSGYVSYQPVSMKFIRATVLT